MQISTAEWERMREQRKLLFNKNAPSAIIQDKGRKKEVETSVRPSPDPKSPTEHAPGGGKQQRYNGGGATGSVCDVSPTDKLSPVKAKTTSGGWFKRKKREASNESSVSTTGAGTGGKVATKKDATKKASLGHKTARNEEVKKERGSKQSASSQKSPVGVQSWGKGARRRRGGGKVTSIDDVDMEENDEKWGKGVRKTDEVTGHVKKTFSYEGNLLPSDTNKPATNIPRSQSHNATFRSTLLQAVQQQQQHNRSLQEGMIEAPVIAHHHHRSKSYHEEEEVAGVVGGGGDKGWADDKLSVEARETSRSQSDVSRLKTDADRVEIDPNLRLKKSGVVKDVSTWGQRPSLEVSVQLSEKDSSNSEISQSLHTFCVQVFEKGEMRGAGKGGMTTEQTDSTDGPGTPEMTSDTGIYITSYRIAGYIYWRGVIFGGLADFLSHHQY